MTTVEAASALLAEIENLVTGANVDCSIDSYRVTPGEPAAPVGSCSAISVWVSSYFNAASSLFQEDNPCLTVRGIQLHWRLDLCFTESEKDRPPADLLADSECVYGLSDAIWCGLLSSAPGIFDQHCSALEFDPLTVNPALGGNYSAESGIRVQLDCTPPPTS